jgi:hypothetical protein
MRANVSGGMMRFIRTAAAIMAAMMKLARRFHGWLECARVDQLKSAPDQRGSRLSKPASSQIEEHLSGEAA